MHRGVPLLGVPVRRLWGAFLAERVVAGSVPVPAWPGELVRLPERRMSSDHVSGEGHAGGPVRAARAGATALPVQELGRQALRTDVRGDPPSHSRGTPRARR